MTYAVLTAVLAVLLLATRYGLGPSLVVAAYRRDGELARSCWQAARIRRRWSHLARALGLVLPDKASQGPLASRTDAGPGLRPKYRAPKIRVTPDAYGIVAELRTVPGVGLTELQAAARHLADEWRSVRVAVVQVEPGRLRIRAVRRDPLGVSTEYTADPADLTDPGDLTAVLIGLDEYAEPVYLRLAGVSGITIGGLPGYGKTSLLLGLISRLAPSPAVQFVVIDGKVDDPATEGDYVDVADRCAILCGDDLEAANTVLRKLSELRRARSRSIRTLLGVVNFWHVPITAAFPLVVVIIDECHTFFRQVKAAPKSPQADRNRLADENAMLVEDLIKKGRSVGLLVILATQKQTGDAVPTFIRDVCAVSLAFACRTIDAAVAALGDDIRQHPDANPVGLQDPLYVGVATMYVQGRPGFTRVRMPYVPAVVAAAVATATASLCGRRGELPAVPPAVMIGAGDDE